MHGYTVATILLADSSTVSYSDKFGKSLLQRKMP